MAWTMPITFFDNTVLTAAQLNTFIRDNMLETMPARATAEGSIFVGTGRNSIAERVPRGAYLADQEVITDSDGYVLLGTGPSISVKTGTSAMVFLSCDAMHTSSGAQMGYAVSGATEIEASNDRAIMTQSTVAIMIAGSFLQTGLTPGINTFASQYGMIASGTATFRYRRIAVLPL